MSNELVESLKDKATGLDERDTHLLSILFEECRGDLREAMTKSGYKKTDSALEVSKRLKKHIIEASKDYLGANSAKAAMTVVDVIVNPTMPGATNALKAAKELMDRTGVMEEEAKTKVTEQNIFILPAKDIDVEEA